MPNVFPVIILFGVMGYAGIPLNIGTTMAAAIAIGIAVDDTLHFMLRYNQELRTSKSQTLAMQNTIYEEALPVMSTSIVSAAHRKSAAAPAIHRLRLVVEGRCGRSAAIRPAAYGVGSR